MIVQAQKRSCVTHAIEREKRSRIMVSLFSMSFSVILTVSPTSYYFPLREHGDRTRLNVNYRSLPAGFSVMDGTVSGTAEGYSADIADFVRYSIPRKRAELLSHVLPDFVLGRGTVFQFATSFAPLSVQSRASRTSLSRSYPISKFRQLIFRSYSGGFWRRAVNANSYPSLY